MKRMTKEAEEMRLQQSRIRNRMEELTQSCRIDICYRYVVLNLPMNQIADLTGLNYYTIRSVCHNYRHYGDRYNRSLNYMTRKLVLSKKLLEK